MFGYFQIFPSLFVMLEEISERKETFFVCFDHCDINLYHRRGNMREGCWKRLDTADLLYQPNFPQCMSPYKVVRNWILSLPFSKNDPEGHWTVSRNVEDRTEDRAFTSAVTNSIVALEYTIQGKLVWLFQANCSPRDWPRQFLSKVTTDSGIWGNHSGSVVEWSPFIIFIATVYRSPTFTSGLSPSLPV